MKIFSSSYSSSLFNNEDLLKSISYLEFQIKEVSNSISHVEKQILDLEMPIKTLLDKQNLSEEEKEKKKYFLASLRRKEESLRRKEESLRRKEEEKASLRESLRRKEVGSSEMELGIS